MKLNILKACMNENELSSNAQKLKPNILNREERVNYQQRQGKQYRQRNEDRLTKETAISFVIETKLFPF